MSETSLSSDGFVSDLMSPTPEQEAAERAEAERIEAFVRERCHRGEWLVLPERPVATPDCCKVAQTSALVQWGKSVSFVGAEKLEVSFGEAGWVIDGPCTNADEPLVERYAVKFCPFCGSKLSRMRETYMRAMFKWLREVHALSVAAYDQAARRLRVEDPDIAAATARCARGEHRKGGEFSENACADCGTE